MRLWRALCCCACRRPRAQDELALRPPLDDVDLEEGGAGGGGGDASDPSSASARRDSEAPLVGTVKGRIAQLMKRPCHTSTTTKGGAVIGCGAPPPPPPHLLFCARRHAAAAASTTAVTEGGVADEGGDDERITPDTAHAHAVAFTATTLSEMSIENFDDGARDAFEWTGLGVPRDDVRVPGAGARAGSVIVETSVTGVCDAEAAAAFASSLTNPAKPLVDEFRFGPCAVSGLHIEELAVAAAVLEEAPEPAATPEPAPPPTPAVTDNGPLRSTVVVFHGDDDNGGPWGYAVADDEGERDEEGEAVRQDSSGTSAAAAAAAGGLGLQLSEMLCTGVLTRKEESPSPPAPESPSLPGPYDASATGRTYDDITKSPPPHLRCVVSPLPSLPPALRCTAAPPPHFVLSPTSRG